MEINILIIIAKIFVPVTVVILKFLYPEVKYGWFFVLFIVFVMLERVFETSKSGNFNKYKNKLKQDVFFKLVVLGYLILMFLTIFEFFIFNREVNLVLVVIGIAILLLAFSLRLWAIKILGEGWQIQGLQRDLVTNLGPFKFTRHPIYLGSVLESIAIPLTFSAFFSLVYSTAVLIPLFLIKTYYEEKELFSLYGAEYREYISKVGFLFPRIRRNR